MMTTKNNQSGFTLIELLVVLAIIALLASVIFASMSSIQKKSRDTRRMEDVNTIVKALALYQTGQNHYPVSVATTNLTGTDNVSVSLIGDSALTQMPTDPLQPAYTYRYTTNSLGNEYTVHFCLEGDSIPGYASGCVNSVTP